MRIQIYHRTEYLYAEDVTNNANELRLTPKLTPSQTVESSFISVLPAARLRRYDDLNFNRVHHFTIPQEHKRLLIESQSIVQTKIKYNREGHLPYGFKYSSLHLCRRLEECHSFLQNSTYVELTPEVWREAVDIRAESDDVLQICHQIMEHIYEHFNYRTDVTNVSTHSSEVIRGRVGVCQDYAHAMVAYCRSLGIPARYVSGYFYDDKRDNKLRGGEASHAWVEIYIVNYGWIGLDPTNRKVVDDTYIILALGRDYRDVAPVIGTYFGRGPNSLKINVQVNKID